MKNGTYNPNWGTRYFAELVNPIPRALWHGKPMIGIDYAIARGQAGGQSGEAGVYATISTGMIGQGVVNFGRILGPAFAALLMSFWVAILARLDLQIYELGRLPLYALGLILTFNLGRDITLITLYPFVFGAMGIWWLERYHLRSHPRLEPKMRQKKVVVLNIRRTFFRMGARRPQLVFFGRKKSGVSNHRVTSKINFKRIRKIKV